MDALKGYWVGHIDIEDAEGYRAYVKEILPLLKRWDGVLLVAGGDKDPVEGHLRSHSVVVEFPSYQRARDCYHSDEYREVIKLRLVSSVAECVIVEGYDSTRRFPS